MKKIKVAFLHLLPIAGDIPHNQSLVEKALKQLSNKNIDWVITPELAVSGLQFAQEIGTEWISSQPDDWLGDFTSIVHSVQATTFIGCPEREDDGLFNSVFVIHSNGQIIGKQQKINVHSDMWATSGKELAPIKVDDVQVGVMICADAYTENIAASLATQGAEILIAPSSWGPGLYGPNGEWERRSLDTGLPIFVCNRTGEDATVSFWEAESSVIQNGKKLLSYSSRQSSILVFEWDVENMELLSPTFQVEIIR